MSAEAKSELRKIFDLLAKAGGNQFAAPERTIHCDVMDTLFLHESKTREPYGNIALYRLLLAFNQAGAQVVLNCDNALDQTHPDVASFLREIAELGLSDRLLRDSGGTISIAAWPKPEVKCGVLIDNNFQGHGHRAHVYYHPADRELHELQDAAAEPGLKSKFPNS